MNYITEARRLGVDIPFNDIEGDRWVGTTPWEDVRDEDGLHISGCSPCRSFRNRVRAAQREKAMPYFTSADMDLSFKAGREEGIRAARDAFEDNLHTIRESIRNA